ncbi:hypothetical protein [Paractinoplanes hotanensis]|uniref:Uncharacterized protein n=1 Tax=Paractinoplanes hotanensis TaxID=2906497 RepID=A0ABT0YFG9_9ACTN|nr:hypothetical protein [Actinoplanes hotanensis]MCM4084258.1 hypothetical protein [Actinoplanes hotanensis]
MNDSAGFERELHDRLADLAGPAPAPAGDLVGAIRRRATRRRRRVRLAAAAGALLAVVGSGAIVGQAVLGSRPAPSGVSGTAGGELLGWPTRTSGAERLDTGLVERAWPGQHTAVHVLYSGAPAGGSAMAVIEGRADTGEVRLAVLTRSAGGWQVRLDAAGFSSPPEQLFVAFDTAGESSTITAISAPGAPQVRINNTGGQPVAFLAPASAEQFTVPRDTVGKLRLYVSRSATVLEEWTLSRRATAGSPGAQVTALVPGERHR